MCSRCRIRKAAAAGALCLLCLGWPTGTGPQHHHAQPAAVISAPPADHAEQPHPPEIEGTQPVHGVMAEVRLGGYFTLDDLVLGQFDGPYGLGPPALRALA
jgi:hypothetical protein